MNKALIQKHNFDIAKSNIERFSRNLPSNPSFSRVEVDGGFLGLGDHKVTGYEMNAFIGVVQDKLISVNASLRSIIREFKDVYDAFDFLDGEYISGIITSVESAEDASKKALKAQDDIKATVENLRKTVVKLVNLSQTVERIEKIVNIHSSNILSYDEITRRLDNNYKIKQLPSLANTLSTLKESHNTLLNTLSSISAETRKIKELFSLINSQKQRNDVLSTIYSQLSSNLHYKDIDTIWSDVEKYKKDLANVHRQVEVSIERFDQSTVHISNDITALQHYRKVLESYEHLRDIDTIWCDVEEQKTDLTGFHRQVDAFMERLDLSIERINNDITSLQHYRKVLESYEHLRDIDTIWCDVEEQKTDLTCFHRQVDAFMERFDLSTECINNDITSLQHYRKVLESYDHLGDIDTVWSDVEECKTDLVDLHQQVSSFISEVHATELEIRASIRRLEETNALAQKRYDNRMMIAYCIGGSALAFSIIDFVLKILGTL